MAQTARGGQLTNSLCQGFSTSESHPMILCQNEVGAQLMRDQIPDDCTSVGRKPLVAHGGRHDGPDAEQSSEGTIENTVL